MTVPQFSPINPYGQVRRSELERMARTAETHDRLSGVNGLNVSRNASGLYVADARPKSILIEITGGSNPYSWKPKLSDEGALSDDLYNGEGAISTLPAYEENSNPSVTAGTVVRAWLSDDKRSYWFAHCCGLVGFSGSGAGALVTNTCCPGGVPQTLYATLTCPAVACVDGQVITLAYDALSDSWSGEESHATGRTTRATVYCRGSSGDSAWYIQVLCLSGTTGAGGSSAVINEGGCTVGLTECSRTCSPFALSYTDTVYATMEACCQAGPYTVQTLTVDVTE